MKRFLVTYQSTASAAELTASLTPQQAEAGLAAWMKWAHHAGSAVVELGMPLATATVHTATARPAPTKTQTVGFSIMQAESVDALAKALEGHPHYRAPGASIIAHEVLPIQGM